MPVFNEQYYLNANPDVAAAVARGEFTAEEHFELFGKFENRSPSPFFDPTLYAQANPDVAAAVQAGTMPSLYDHFEEFGQAEGRDASFFFDPQVYLAQNPDVAAAIQAGTMTSAWQHFLDFGQNEVRNTSQFFDLKGYLEANPDVAAAVQAGTTTAFDHFINFGFQEGRDLGNGISLAQFANDPVAHAAIESGNIETLMERVGEVAPFLPTYHAPSGYEIPSDQPIPQNFVPVEGENLVVPPGVVVPPGTDLPPAFEQPSEPGNPGDGGGDVTPPPAPMLALAHPGDTFDTTPQFTGTAEPGSTVKILSDSLALIGTVTAGPDGIFTFTSEQPLSPGQHSFTAIATDAAGNSSIASEAVSLDVRSEDVKLEQPGGDASYYATLQEAVDAAQNDATVTVRAGAELTGDVIISKDITILGENAGVAADEDRHPESVLSGGIRINGAAAAGTVIDGLKITGTLAGSTDEGATILVLADGVTIEHNVISSTSENAASGIVIGTGVTDAVIKGNDISGYEVGAYANPVYGQPAGTTIVDNHFSNNRESLVAETGTKEVSGNTFDDSGTDVRVSLRHSGDFNLSDFIQANDFGEDRGVEARISGNSHVIGTDGNDTIRVAEIGSYQSLNEGSTIDGGAGDNTLIGGTGNDTLIGGSGKDTVTGGLGNNTLFSSAGNDVYHATTGETISFEFQHTADSGFQQDVTTFDFSHVNVAQPVPLTILLGGADFEDVAGAIENTPTIAAFGIGRDSQIGPAERPETPGFFLMAAGDTARLTPGVSIPPPEVGDQSLVVYDKIGNDEFNVYFDTNANGNLDAGDGLIHVVGLNNAAVSWAASSTG